MHTYLDVLFSGSPHGESIVHYILKYMFCLSKGPPRGESYLNSSIRMQNMQKRVDDEIYIWASFFLEKNSIVFSTWKIKFNSHFDLNS